jgi:glycosyltransferase involved in cell wall biosynthesis
MSRIIFLNRYFPPDQSATSQLVGDLAYYLAAAGYDVSVVTSQQLYDKLEVRLPRREIINSVQIHRVPTTRFGRSKLIGRAFDYASYYVAARRLLSSLVQAGDTIVAMTDPPLISSVAASVAKRRQAHLVNWLQDIYPETAFAIGVPLVKGPLLRVLISQRNSNLRMARANVVVGERMAETLASLNIPRRSIHIIPNWTEDSQIRPVAPEQNPLREAWGLKGKFVFGYSGNLGRAHEYLTVLEAAEILRNNSQIIFLMIGGGHHFRKLAQAVKERDLTNFVFLEYQDRSVLKFSLSVPDVHWLSLDPHLEGLIVPSKFYGIAAAGRPVIAIGSKDGEIARLVRDHQCGFVVEPANSGMLADAILQLCLEPELCDMLGQRARTMVENLFSRRRALERWREIVGASTLTG